MTLFRNRIFASIIGSVKMRFCWSKVGPKFNDWDSSYKKNPSVRSYRDPERRPRGEEDRDRSETTVNQGIAGQPAETGKGQGRLFPRDFRGRMALPMPLLWTSTLRNCERERKLESQLICGKW